MGNKFYDLGQVAEMLQVRPEMVWAFIQSGQLRSMRLGKRTIRIMDEDLQVFICRLRGVAEKKQVLKEEK